MRKLLGFLVVLVFVSGASALFEPIFVGGKYVGVGGANITEVNDPYAMIYNPSGLSYIKGIAFSVSYSEPFGVPGMSLVNVNLAGNIFDIFQTGVSLSAYGVNPDVGVGLYYSTLGISFAKKFGFEVDVLDEVSVGLTGKLLRLSLSGYEIETSLNGDKVGFSMDVGASISLVEENFKIAVVGYNLVPYTFSFIGGTNGTQIFSGLGVGASLYLVKPYMKVFSSYTLGLNSNSSSSLSVGTEISYADTIFTRIGLKDNNITMGLGLKGPGFEINFGVQNRGNLGWYYQIDVLGFVDIF